MKRNKKKNSSMLNIRKKSFMLQGKKFNIEEEKLIESMNYLN